MLVHALVCCVWVSWGRSRRGGGEVQTDLAAIGQRHSHSRHSAKVRRRMLNRTCSTTSGTRRWRCNSRAASLSNRDAPDLTLRHTVRHQLDTIYNHGISRGCRIRTADTWSRDTG